MMKRRQRGMILVMTLLLLGVISALILTQLEMVLLNQKIMNQFVIRQQLRQSREQIAFDLMASLLHRHQLQANCVVAAFQNPNEVITALKSKRGCVVAKDQMSYLYLIEDLGVQACLQTAVQDVLYSTRHWRLTIGGESDGHEYLQIRVAEPAPYRDCLNKLVLWIEPGIVSWRGVYTHFT